MNVYKLIFARNTVVACCLANNQIKLDSEYYYEHDKGKVIYAVVKAPTEDDAIAKGHKIIKEVTEKVFGSDYLFK